MLSQALILGSDAFLDCLQNQAEIFKSTSGFGRWLKEYQDMDKAGLFEPEELKELYIKYLNGKFNYGYVYLSAVHYIAVKAYEDTIQTLSNADFCIMTNTGDIYCDEDGDALTDLELDEAIDICKAINEDAVGYIVYVADSLTEKFVYRI